MGQSFAKLVASRLADAKKIGPTPHNRFEAWAFIREAIDDLWECVKCHNYAGNTGGASGQDAELLSHLVNVATRAARFALEIERVSGWHAGITEGIKTWRTDEATAPIMSGHEAYARLFFAQGELACAVEDLVRTAETKLVELAVLAQLAAEDLGLVADEPKPKAKAKAKANGRR